MYTSHASTKRRRVSWSSAATTAPPEPGSRPRNTVSEASSTLGFDRRVFQVSLRRRQLHTPPLSVSPIPRASPAGHTPRGAATRPKRKPDHQEQHCGPKPRLGNEIPQTRRASPIVARTRHQGPLRLAPELTQHRLQRPPRASMGVGSWELGAAFFIFSVFTSTTNNSTCIRFTKHRLWWVQPVESQDGWLCAATERVAAR